MAQHNVGPAERAGCLGAAGAFLIAVIVIMLVLQAHKGDDPAPVPSGVHTGTQQASVDPSCFVEGKGVIVPFSCNDPQIFPWCPAEDSPMHEGEPCFWRSEQGLLWSDGQSDE